MWVVDSFPDVDWALLLGGGMALVGGTLAAVTVIVYFGGFAVEYLDRFARAVTRTRQSTAAEAASGLTADQLAMVRMTGELSVGLRLTASGPIYMVEGTGVPLAFVKFEFLPRCGMDTDGLTHLAPIGSWGDGKTYQYQGRNYGQCRTLAKRLTQYLVDIGLAVWGKGNQAATLVGDLTVFELRKSLGMIDRVDYLEDVEYADPAS